MFPAIETHAQICIHTYTHVRTKTHPVQSTAVQQLVPLHYLIEASKYLNKPTKSNFPQLVLFN